MTLDEAIAHAKEIAKTQRAEAEEEKQNQDNKVHMFNGKFPADYTKSEKCLECAEEHEQLAAWLEELKRYKAQKFVIKVDYNKAPALKELLRHSQFGMAYPDGQYEVVPLVSGGPQGECRTCRHRDPEDKKCDCGGLERQGCPFPVSDDYFCKFYEKGGAEE